MNDQRSADFLALAIENSELRQQLADVQDQCIELAVDAGEQHAENGALRARLAQAERDRDAWRAEADRLTYLGVMQPAPALPLPQADEHQRYRAHPDPIRA